MSKKDEPSRVKVVCLDDDGVGAKPDDVRALCDVFFDRWGEALYATLGGDEWWFYVCDELTEERRQSMRDWVDGYLAARQAK